jgi:hypothetical protein
MALAYSPVRRLSLSKPAWSTAPQLSWIILGIIHLWWEDEQAPCVANWFSHTGKQRLFATIDQLLIFLAAQVENDAAADQQERTDHEKSRD